MQELNIFIRLVKENEEDCVTRKSLNGRPEYCFKNQTCSYSTLFSSFINKIKITIRPYLQSHQSEHVSYNSVNHKNYNFIDCDWFKVPMK